MTSDRNHEDSSDESQGGQGRISGPQRPAIKPGWYSDPRDPLKARWWNGSTWTHNVQPLPSELLPPEEVSSSSTTDSGPVAPGSTPWPTPDPRLEEPESASRREVPSLGDEPVFRARDAKDCGSCIVTCVVFGLVVWGLIWAGMKVYHHFNPERHGDEVGFVSAMRSLPNGSAAETGVSDEKLIAGGYEACDALTKYGMDPVRGYFMDGQGLNAAEAAVVIGNAIFYLCPENQKLVKSD